MQGKFEINWNYYSLKRSKFIYTKNRVKEKVLQYLEPCFQLNSIISFIIIDDLFNYLKNIFSNSH